MIYLREGKACNRVTDCARAAGSTCKEPGRDNMPPFPLPPGGCRGHLRASLQAPCLLICSSTILNFFPLSMEKKMIPLCSKAGNFFKGR